MTEQLIRWALLLVYAGLTGGIALTGAFLAVYAGSILPTTFGTVILRWFSAIVLVAASPNLAGWIARYLVASTEPNPDD